MHRVSNGLSPSENKKSHEALREILANTFVLSMKTLNYHWHVIGPHFHTYHDMFQGQYQDLNEAIDILAERIRALGHIAPHTCTQMLEHSSIKESEANISAEDMIGNLVDDHFLIVQIIRSKIHQLEMFKDAGTVDILTERMNEHEKVAWMLQSHLL